MPIKNYKPNTPGTRGMSTLVNDEITKSTPEKSLLVKKSKTGGRNNQGKITVRHIGGGVRRKYRVIDFKRTKDGIDGRVASIEYDPNRSANIALINYADGEKRYIIAPLNLKVGDIVESGANADIKVGNALPLENIPVGTMVHNVELNPGAGAKLARSAGSSVQILGREGKYVIVRLKSGETRKILANCRATIGEVGNTDYELVNLEELVNSEFQKWQKINTNRININKGEEKNLRLERNLQMLTQSHYEMENNLNLNEKLVGEKIDMNERKNDRLLQELEIKDMRIKSLENLLFGASS